MKILFVCLGNICRSPLAEGIMRHKVMESQLDIKVDSAGTQRDHVGEPPDKRAIAVAHKHGIDISTLVARKFCSDDFELFDKIYVMDLQNKKEVLKMSTNKEATQKVELLLNMLHPASDAEVPDPWYGGAKDFEEVFQLLNDACEAVIKILR